ncbi:ABC transporter ATP-binding protein [Capnocytophaga stomatis]|uniref:ABC transporter ATP-binding protein n=1 Tax=Capnocytophaga stomatis TaxID=1848904 RepID=UPI001AC22BE9|nr:ABC transporter ATP-binding protein [Capnocytophaga stomatis]GIM49973.1 ABC transporter ATP-binding protein [Capnocytophaga stomatis]
MLEVNNISYTHDGSDTGFHNISFQLKQGEHLSVMGESGCGKSTLLKALYGLFDLHEGTIFFNKKKVVGPSRQLVPGFEKMKYLAQDFGLMPYHTVAENVGKFLSNIDLEYKKQRVNELLSLVEMESFANRKALLLSGGEKQRIGLAMALAQEPELLILDEPFSQIDNFRRSNLQRTLFLYLKTKKISCIVATHDGKEALSFSDKALIMRDGNLLMFGDLLDVYNQKDDFYTASLFGDVSKYVENGKTILLKPYQIEVVEKSGWETLIENCYFQGENFLVIGISNGEKVHFLSNNPLEIGKKVYLSKKN